MFVCVVCMFVDCLTCDKLFTLCGVFGDVHRVKISYHKRDTAFVQLANHRQAKHLVNSLNRIQLYGKMIHANLSRMTRVKMPKDSPNSTILFPDAKFLTRDYTSSMKHRYTKRSGIPGAVKYQPLSIGQPSHILHMANLPRDTSAEELRNLLEGHHHKTKGDKVDGSTTLAAISSPHSTTSNSDGGIGNRIQGIELVNGNTKSTTCQAFARCSSVDVACQILIEYHGKDFFGRDIKISFASRSHMPSDISKTHVYYNQTQQNNSTNVQQSTVVKDDKRFEYFGTFYDGNGNGNGGKRFPYREKSTVHHSSHGRSYDHRNVNYYNAQDRYTVQYPRYTENIPYSAVQNRYQQSYVEIPDNNISPLMNDRYVGGRYMVDNVLSMRNPAAYQTYTVMDGGKSSRSEGGNRGNINSPLNQRNHQRFIQHRSTQVLFFIYFCYFLLKMFFILCLFLETICA